MRRAVLAILSTIAGLIMLLSFKTHGAVTATGLPAPIGGSTSSAGGSSTATPTPTASAGGSSSAASSTITGDSADTRFGPVQVRITVTNGKLTDVTAINYPNGSGRDQEINAYAIPQLNQEALQAGNANIDMVSGATYTSDGYITSLQSALDRING
ncbi:MAG: FMN-binding protein [Sporichthyaceae bacterium]